MGKKLTQVQHDAIATLLNLAEGPSKLSFTCCIAETVGFDWDYIEIFSIAGKTFFLSDDPEFAYSVDGIPISDEHAAQVLNARQDWRRTALCFAAALIATGDLFTNKELEAMDDAEG